MNELQKQLNMISQTLALLSDQIEMVSGYLKKEEAVAKPVKAAPAPVEKPVKAEKKKAAKPKAAPVVKVVEEAAPVEEDSFPSDKPAEILKSVLEVIKRSRKGTSIKILREKTGFGPRQVSNALYKLTKQGVIKTKSRGIYVKS